MKKYLVCFTALAVFILTSLPLAVAAATPLRVLPVGDSITYGSSVNGGYRLPLQQLLTAAGYTFDFTGTQTGNSVGMTDPEHEGYGGYRIDQIDTLIIGSLSATADPDVILLMIGTNDYGQGYNTANATNRLEALIVKMALARPNAKIIVASLTQRNEPYETQIQTTYNPFVPLIVARQAALGRQVYFTDMHAAVPVADMPDQLHPGALGYAKMATNWFVAITNQFTTNGSTTPLGLSRAYAMPNLSNVVVTFSRMVADDAATLTNYSLGGFGTVLAASLDATTKRDVTLTTTPLTPNVLCTLTVNGVRDRTDATLVIPTNSTITFYTYSSTAGRGAHNNVSESDNYALVYSLNIPNAPNYTTNILYDINLKNYVSSNFSRVAYYLELQATNSPASYVWVSMDAFTTNLNLVGVPTISSGAYFQQPVANMNVFSSATNIQSGTNFTGGWIEFWPSNYVQANVASVPNASSLTYDWGDQMTTTGTYGSMQVHNAGASQVLFAFNRWNAGSPPDVGIGNCPASIGTNADWTWTYLGTTYNVKTLQVFVLPANNTNAPVLVSAVGLGGCTNVTLSFSQALGDDATNVTYYSLSGGVSVLGATLEPIDKLSVTLTTTLQAPLTYYTVTANGMHDRTTNHNQLTTNSTISFQSSAGRGALGSVPEAANYSLVYSLNIPNAAAYNTTPPVYAVDLHSTVSNFTRVAYYLELQASNGSINFIWTSMDPFTQDPGKIGVPYQATGVALQQPVTNLTVLSTMSGIVQGTNMSGGNMEFWYWNYTAPNGAGVTNASATTYDWGDTMSTGTLGYGSMQMHNASRSQVLWAFNNWGGTGSGNIDLGIGNGTGANPDWTFMNNAATYAVKTLQVYVLQANFTNPPVLLSATAPTNSTVLLTFSKPLDDTTASNVANYAVSGGVTVQSAVLDPITKLTVTLTTSPQAGSTFYTVTVNNVTDRTTIHTVISPNSTATFLAPAVVNGLFANVPEAANYSLVYSLNVPSSASFNSTNPLYAVDLHGYVSNFTRLGYYMELQQPSGPIQIMWVTLDPFTQDTTKIGVPNRFSGALFQQPVTNLSVFSTVSGVTLGTNMSGGNMEFWCWDYTEVNALNVTNASTSVFDWGDRCTTNGGGYGSMQIHNNAARQTLFAMNNFGVGGGGNGDICLGIGNNTSTTASDWTHVKNASSYSVRTLQVLALPAVNVNPVLVSAVPQVGLSNVVVTFSKTVTDAATNLANYAISGATVLAAVLDPVSKAQVTFTTTPLSPATFYTLTANNVQDRTASHLALAPGSTANFVTPGVRSAFNNVPAVSNYTLVYSLDIPNAATFNTTNPLYTVDAHNYVSNYSRVAYYLELQQANGPLNFAWVEMDTFTNNSGKLGVPFSATGAFFQQPVTNLTVFSSMPGVTACTNASGGNMEFWPFNYDGSNSLNVAGASSITCDWGDHPAATNGVGSMQIHNSGASQVVFALNNWGGPVAGNIDLGLGNNSLNTNMDWTGTANAATYAVKTLQVFVLSTNNVAPVLLSGAAPGYTTVALTFSKPLTDDATNTAYYALSSGVSILSAALDPVTKAVVTLTTTTLLPGRWYTATVTGPTDRTTSHLAVAPGSTTTFMAPALRGVFNNLSEAADYLPVYTLNIPNTPNYSAGIVYDVDNHTNVSAFTRVAYYLELQASGGPVSYVWVSMDAFTNNVNTIGVPVATVGAYFQRPVSNLNVYSSVATVTQGTGLTGGNIEFWPWSYTQTNAANVTNASSANYDFGDYVSVGSGNYGSMQVHNHDASQTLFAFNRWGGAGGTADLGIGNRPGYADTDWTTAQNASAYTVKTLQVFVLPATNPVPTLTGVAAPGGYANPTVVLTFNKPLDDDATNVFHYALSGGLSVLSAILDATNKLTVTLTTTAQQPATWYTVTVSGLYDRTSSHLGLVPSTGSFLTTALARSGAYANVPDAAKYSLVYSLNVPTSAAYNTTNILYAADNHFGVTNYTRIAYYLELIGTNNGATNFIWAAMDPFTQDAGKIGLPTKANNVVLQQPVTNLTVFSSVAGIVAGTNMAGGNIEFWPWNYTQGNASNVANASSLTYDWGDSVTLGSGNYACLQIHNALNRQTLLALDNFGSNGGDIDIGICNQVGGNGNPDYTQQHNASAYSVRTLQVFVLPATDTNAFLALRAVQTVDLRHIILTFSEPVADSAALLANYSLSGGPTLLGAVLSNNLREVIFTTSPQTVGTTYTLNVSGVHDRSANANSIAPGTSLTVGSVSAMATVAANVPEARNYQLAYYLNIPTNSPGWNTNGTTYTVDARAFVGSFTRIAYCLELATNGGPTNWVYASMDAFTSDVNKIGVPDKLSGASFQQKVTNMNIFSSVAGIVTGTGITTGNIEFWPSNYAQANSLSIPNASASTFDFGDQPTTSTYWYDGHGSMQVHNYGASQVLFAYNAWGYARTSDIGIGNQVGGNGNPDYTSMANAGNYAVRNLYVLVLPAADTNAPLIVSATNCFNTTNVLVKFNESLADDAATLTNFSLSGGLTVLAATLRPTMKDILLTTSPQTQGTTYTLTVNGIRDRSTNANLIAANSTVTFTALALPVYARVPEAAGFTLLEYLALPGPVPNYNTAGLTYNLDQRSLITQPVNRIAYYLELATTVGGTTNWIYVSTEAFTTNLNAMGVPIYGLGVFQQRLTNMNVYSSVSGIVTGAGITTGNMEFWPGNYTGATNTLGITTNGNGTAFDWNDVNSGGSGYACMQIHNWGANSTGQVLFAYNHWGGGQSGNTCLGIGTQPATQNMDWTFTENGSTYAVKNLYILVQTTNAPAPVVVPTPMLAPVIVLQPASRTNWVGESTTLAALASGTGPIAGQWRLNGSPLANQTNSWLSFSSLQTGNSGSYDFVATNSVGSVTSLVAVLTVNADPVGPQIVSVGSLDGWDIGIIFDKPIDAGASDLLANLSINAGTISFSSPVLRPDGRTVLLWLDSPVSTPFTVEASYMVNQSGAQTDYSAASGIVLDALASSLNIGVGVGTVDPLYVGSAFVGSSSNFIEVLAGGSGLTSVTDSFHAVSQNLNGDFVAKVQVTGLLPSDPNALAGLMVRPSLANNDRQFSIFTTPAVVDGGAGALQTIIRATSNATATVVGTVSQFAFPNNWVRLQRSGNTFTTAFSSNGVDWIAVTTNTPSPAYPTTIVLGLATTAHNNNPSAYTKAGYASLGIVAPLRILTQPQPASVTADVRTSVTFSNVTVSSPLPVTYQWRKNGVSIPGATGTNLTLANLSLSNAATYTVAVINDFETVISDPCTLTVTNALPIVTPDFLSATQGVARVVSAVSLLGNDSDPEGAVLTIVGAYGQAVTFTTDFNSGLPSGTLTNGNAFVDTTGGVGNSGVLKLTTNGGTLNGWFAVSNLTPGKAVAAFSASFKVLLTGGTATPADGFSFNFGTNYGAPGEEGFATGLSVCFDTYNNGATEVPVNGAPAIDVKWNGVQIGHVMMPIYSNANWQPVGITLNFDGTLDVTFNGTNVYQGFPTGYVPAEGAFILGARTGGQYETHYIDDLTLTVYTRHTALGNTTVGGTVAVTNGVVYYNPPAVGCGSDSFYYIVSDGQPGGTNTGLATVALQWVASGQVTLEGYAGPAGNGNGSRAVTFAATDGATFTNRTVQTLTFTGGSATYSLLVPQGTTRVSAKTAWNLRQTQTPAFAPCQAVANFVLRTGDLDGSNQVDLSDYYLLVAAWYQAGPAADLDGSGLVTLEDYFLMASRWLQTGDPE